MKHPSSRIETQLIHAGEPSPLIEGAISMPIFQSSTFAYRGEGDYHALRYIRLNNTPNHVALHQKLAAIEQAEAALVTSSGMAAVAATLLTLLGTGDHLIAQDCLYGGTHDQGNLCRDDLESADSRRRPQGCGRVRARPQAGLDYRQHLRESDQLPAGSIGL